MTVSRIQQFEFQLQREVDLEHVTILRESPQVLRSSEHHPLGELATMSKTGHAKKSRGKTTLTKQGRVQRRRNTAPGNPRNPVSRHPATSSPCGDKAKHEQLAALAKKLLPIGGNGIETRTQHSLKDVLEQGRHFAECVTLERGIAQECHRNAALIWADAPQENQLVTGYALTQLPLFTADGQKQLPLWVAHSWVLRGASLIETTFQYDAYFGVVLSATVAYKFFSENVMARDFPGGAVPVEFLERYKHLAPLALEAMRGALDDLPAELLLDVLISQITDLGLPSTLIEQCRNLKKSGNLTPDKVSFLRASLLQFNELLLLPGQGPENSNRTQLALSNKQS